MFGNFDKSPKVFPEKQRKLFPTHSAEKQSFPAYSGKYAPKQTQPKSNPFEDPKKTANLTQPNPKFSFPAQKNPDSIDTVVQMFKRQLQERDRRIQNLQTQVKTLSNAVNMCMMVISQKKQKVELFNPDKEKQIPKPVSFRGDNPLNVIGPISLIGSEVIHEDLGYKMHRPLKGDLAKAQDVKVQNNNGKIMFKQPINLLQVSKRLSECIKIESSNIKVLEDMMKNKKCEIILYNFKNYLDSSFEEKEQTVKFIENMVADNNPKMQVVQFDRQIGNLYLRSSGI